MDAKAKVVAWEYRHRVRGSWSDWKPCSVTDAIYCSADPEFETRQLIPLTDHESALAELRNEKDGVLRQYAENVSAEMEGLLIQLRNAEQRNTTLLTGLEALAGEWDGSAKYAGYTAEARGAWADCARELRRTLASAGLEGK